MSGTLRYDFSPIDLDDCDATDRDDRKCSMRRTDISKHERKNLDDINLRGNRNRQ